MSNKTKLKIIPLGGLEAIGMNITAFEYEDSIIVVDCGLAFPEDDMYGIDLVIPDITYLLENADKVKGFVFTHGHEDHIGALPYILKQLNVPIYATKLTMGLIELKLNEHELMKTTRSVHTGDFKVDFTPVFGDAIDLQRFAEIGRKGVLALMCDSTNAERPGYTPSERTVGRAFDTIFSEHRNSRLIIATFASNVDRVQQIIDTAYKYGRKVIVEGRSMVNVISTAEELGYISIPENTLITLEEMRNYPDEKLVLITTGSQGESMAALSRMAGGIHKKVQIKPGDTIVFSSHPIPGNEKNVSKVMNELYSKGAEVIFQDAHVSGHPCQEEIKLIYSLVKPRYSIPVHGEYRHRVAQARIARMLDYDSDHILMINSGDVLEICDDAEDQAKVTGHVTCGGILVDGLGVGDVGNIVLKDRQRLAEDGIIIVVLTVDSDGNVIAGPDIVSRGFVYVRDSEELMDEAQEVVEDAIDSVLEKGGSEWTKIKNAIRDELGEFLWKRTKRNPMILPILMDAEV